MDENKNPAKKRLSEQLPSHSPDAELWHRISAKLDASDAETIFQEKLQQLPVHSPDQGTWALIYSRLNRIAYYKTATRIGLSAAAGLLLLFSISRISDYYQSPVSVQQVAKQQPISKPEVKVAEESSSPDLALAPKEAIPIQSGNAGKSNSVVAGEASSNVNGSPVAETITLPVIEESGPANELAALAESDTPEETKEAITEQSNIAQNKSILFTDHEPSAMDLRINDNNSKSTPTKYYTPKEPKTGSNKNNFAVAMNYLPENIYNGTDNSLFHNVDFTASYNKEKVRFNTSLGMAYNEEQLEFDMNYNINTPVTATGPDGLMDTIGYNVASMESQYQGTEKHQYFTYNLGLGRRLFKAGNFSTWINAGAGFGIKMNDPDLISATEKKIQNQYNAQITSVNTNKPVYNDVNVNFVTGIDFSYKFFNRLSLTFSPTSRWYFKPVLTVNNQPTDELSLGFKTGMKFDF